MHPLFQRFLPSYLQVVRFSLFERVSGKRKASLKNVGTRFYGSTRKCVLHNQRLVSVFYGRAEKHFSSSKVALFLRFLPSHLQVVRVPSFERVS